MNHVLKLSLFTLMLISMGCQKTAPIAPGAPVAAVPQTGTTIINNLCDDGTLNCIPTTGPGIFTDDASARESLYQSCMMACCNVTPFTSINSNNCPGSSENMTYATCNDNDHCGDILNATEPLYPSEPSRIPDNAKAIKVEIEACYGNALLNTVKFEGATFNFIHQRTSLTQMMDLNIAAKGARGDPVGQGLDCKVQGLYHKVKVNYEPVTSSSVSYADGHSVNVVPFSNGARVERKYSSPNMTTMGIPYEMREELNLEQHNWVLDHAELMGAIQAGVDTGISFQYLINDAYPTTLVNILTSYKPVNVRLKLIFFAEAAQ